MTMHDGHRQRMRERFRANGLEGFAPHEALELLLFYGRARGDVNPVAHELLDAFGSFNGVLEARPEQLMAVKCVGEETATLISLMLPMFRRYQAGVREKQMCIGGKQDAKDYCVSLLAGWRTERFYVLCLSASHRLLGQRLISVGSLSEVSPYPRQVIETALNYNAHSVILCHNHPGGTLRPSREDVVSTRKIAALLSGLDINLLDHLIVAGDDVYSMSEHDDYISGPPPRQGEAAQRLYKSGKEGTP